MIFHKDLESLGTGSLPASKEEKRVECLVICNHVCGLRSVHRKLEVS